MIKDDKEYDYFTLNFREEKIRKNDTHRGD